MTQETLDDDIGKLAKASYSKGFNDACESILEVLEESNPIKA